MHLLTKYRRVSPDDPCPICGHEKWCLIRNDGVTAICQWVKSGLRRGDAGYLHYLPSKDRKPVTCKESIREYLTTQEVAAFICSLRHNEDEDMIGRQAKIMGLPGSSVLTMQAVYDEDSAALVFPMFDSSLRPVGCRFRRRDGMKWSLKGGREGLFIAKDRYSGSSITITEGPTDAAAAVSLGLSNVIGRPNCAGGTAYICELLEPNKFLPVIIIADPDEPGQCGANNLAAKLPNPTIVISGDCDLRTLVIQSKLKRVALSCIVDCVARPYDEDDQSVWRITFRNKAAEFFDFKRSIGR
jgi:hypothetical protein